MPAAAQQLHPVTAARRRKRWTQKELAEAAGVSRAWVSMIERRLADPGFGIQRKLAAALEEDVDVLFPIDEAA